MKQQSAPVEKRRRIRRLILFGVPAVSLLWTGCLRRADYSDEDWYCHRLRCNLLSDYKRKLHQWPTSLDDVERDVEANAYVGDQYPNSRDNSGVVQTFRRLRPVMTVVCKDEDDILVHVRFTRGQSFESDVDANPMLNGGLPDSEVIEKK